MKKIAMLAIALSSVSALAWEADVKTGFDFYRGHHQIGKMKQANENFNDESGWTLGAEFIPYNKGRVDLGAGFEYNFGVTKARYTHKKTSNQTEYNHHFAPIYALARVKLHKSEDNNSSIYTLARFGGAVIGEKGESKGGVYYGLGLGFTAGPAVVEGLYDGAYVPATKDFHHKAGIRVGFRFGDYKIAKPVVVEEPAPVVVEPAPVVEAPVEAPKVIETKGLIHASCSSEEKKCIIYGFKVDGRTPNKEEEKNLAEITTQLNDFYKSGTIDIVGHTDSTGSNAYNQKLSVKRAAEIKKLLEKHGLKSEYTINSVTGKGETQPIKTNKTKAGRYHNRRVELLFDNIVR